MNPILLLLAAMFCAVGLYFQPWSHDVWRDLIFALPHVAGLMLVAFAIRSRWTSACIALVVSGLMAGNTYLDWAMRQTDGFEADFNNAMSGAITCGINYIAITTAGTAIPLYLSWEAYWKSEGGRSWRSESFDR